jgi:hypothetical protein
MVVNVLKGMIVEKGKSNPNEGETIETPFVTVKKEYPIDSSQQQGTQDYGLDLEKDSIDTSPHAGNSHHSSQDIKPDIKIDTLGIQRSIKGTQGKEPKVIHIYNMRTRSGTLDYHNKSITEKNKKKRKVVVKTERVDDNQQVKELNLQVQTLQHHNQELGKLYSKL